MAPTFEKKFRAVCTHCTESTIKTYLFNIRGLAKEAGHSAVPEGHGWINDKLLQQLQKGAATRYKRFTIVAVKLLQAYGIKGPKLKKWQEQMRISTDKYGAIRDKQKRTDREARNWPEGGYQALTGLARKLHGEVAHFPSPRGEHGRTIFMQGIEKPFEQHTLVDRLEREHRWTADFWHIAAYCERS